MNGGYGDSTCRYVDAQDDHGATTEYFFGELIEVKQLQLIDIINGVLLTPTPTQPAPTPSIAVGNETQPVSSVPTPAPTIVRDPRLDEFVNTYVLAWVAKLTGRV